MADDREGRNRRVIPRIRRRASRLAGEGVALGWTASERLADGVVRLMRSGGRLVGDPAVLRARRLRRLNRQPLPNLWEVHPAARLANGRELGLRPVPLDEIVGTAVAGPAQRGGDFLPLPRFRSRNWEGRWQRIRAAVERLELLPPIDLLKYEGCHWVTDGHNRVAAALYGGQVDIDAMVTALVPPGASLQERPATLAELAPDSIAVRAAGSGRWTAAASPGAMDEASAFVDRAPTVRGGRRAKPAPGPNGGTRDRGAVVASPASAAASGSVETESTKAETAATDETPGREDGADPEADPARSDAAETTGRDEAPAP